jgi:hypothetical protein
MVDAVLTYHTDTFRCGVARFNVALAERMGVPCLPLRKQPVAYPLISVKTAECLDGGARDWALVATFWGLYDFFFHDVPRGLCVNDVVRAARRVFAANDHIANGLREIRPDVITAFCPATITANPPRSGLRILTFGMAGRTPLAYFEKLKAVLEASHVDYSVNLSCAVHEGSSWEQTIGEAAERLRPIFGVHFRLLGFLADDALVEEMKRSSGVALFYDPAVRANNTTLWAALEQGCPVVTNLDADSPPELQHDVNVWDIAQMREWPMAERARVLRAGGRKVVEAYSWDRLLEVLK